MVQQLPEKVRQSLEAQTFFPTRLDRPDVIRLDGRRSRSGFPAGPERICATQGPAGKPDLQHRSRSLFNCGIVVVAKTQQHFADLASGLLQEQVRGRLQTCPTVGVESCEHAT